MTRARERTVATLIVVAIGVLYGLYWLPVRQIAEMGLPGAWGTAAITLAGTALLIPRILRRPEELWQADPLALASVALGGAAFALYSIGFVYGHVAMIILLWFLTPVWSTLITRFILGWPTTKLRLWAIFTGLAGLFVMLGAGGQVPLPGNIGEWMALLAGMVWAVATTGIRTRPEMPPIAAGFVFTAGAALCSLAIAPFLASWPDFSAINNPAAMIPVAIGTGGLWWGFAMAALVWAAARLDPARVGILLMAEVLIGSATAAVWAGETLSSTQVVGGALVLVAGVLEVWPTRRNAVT
ncbi:DMT family transporter [Gymnodinialimonas hymeniacidonis]|uniref:DMT family transporter n=1 Tax=Gymnodinialimonas hymeniacidonis TaxID=3126508 RepID=UPI0034C62FBD